MSSSWIVIGMKIEILLVLATDVQSFFFFFISFCLHRNLERESRGLEIPRNHVIKGSIACRSESADSNAGTGISFLRIDQNRLLPNSSMACVILPYTPLLELDQGQVIGSILEWQSLVDLLSYQHARCFHYLSKLQQYYSVRLE